MATNAITLSDVKARISEASKFPEDMGAEMMIPILQAGMLIRNPKLGAPKMVMLTLAAGGLSLVPRVSAELSGTVRLTKSMKARLSHKTPQHGYAHGEKMSTLKAMRVGSSMCKKTVQLVEMSGIIFTPIDTKLDMLENLKTKKHGHPNPCIPRRD